MRSHSQRTLRPLALTAALLACFFAAGAAAATPHTPIEMEAAHGPVAVVIKDDLLKGATGTPSAIAAYAKRLIADYKIELTSTNPDARLNTAILFAELKTVDCDRILIEMLKNPDPSVRYWAAKGLESIAPKLQMVGPSAAAAALKAARAAETSAVVTTQLDVTLKAY